MRSYDETPFLTVVSGREQCVDGIPDRKPELAAELDSQKLPPLHLAIAKGHLGVAKILLGVHVAMCYARDKNVGFNEFFRAYILAFL